MRKQTVCRSVKNTDEILTQQTIYISSVRISLLEFHFGKTVGFMTLHGQKKNPSNFFYSFYNIDEVHLGQLLTLYQRAYK